MKEIVTMIILTGRKLIYELFKLTINCRIVVPYHLSSSSGAACPFRWHHPSSSGNSKYIVIKAISHDTCVNNRR